MKKRLRQKRASRWTENPKGRSLQKLETQKMKNDYPDRLKPARVIYAKVKDHDKVTASVRHNPLGGIQSSENLQFEASTTQRLETGAIQSC